MNTTAEGYKIIKEARTNAKGWGIALMETQNRMTGEPIYMIARVNPQGKFIILDTDDKYTKAQAKANREWCADVSANGAKIGY